MGSVYLAELEAQHGFHKCVALKTLNTTAMGNDRQQRWLLNEARLAAMINHPNVCSVFDFGEADGTLYMTMEYLKGRSLKQVLRKAASARIPMPLALRMIADAARGLHAAHELRGPDGKAAQVVHRDVSPQNIFVLYDGVTKVVDFGIARCVDPRREQTVATGFSGKITYASPEQLNQEALDRRTDVWALGVILFEATTGFRLFKRSNAAQTILAIASDPFPRPSDVLEGYPKELEEIAMAALQRDPTDRTPTALTFALQLEGYLAKIGARVGVQEISEYMASQFAEEIREDGYEVAKPAAPAPIVKKQQAFAVKPVLEPIGLSAAPPAVRSSDSIPPFSDELTNRIVKIGPQGTLSVQANDLIKVAPPGTLSVHAEDFFRMPMPAPVTMTVQVDELVPSMPFAPTFDVTSSNRDAMRAKDAETRPPLSPVPGAMSVPVPEPAATRRKAIPSAIPITLVNPASSKRRKSAKRARVLDKVAMFGAVGASALLAALAVRGVANSREDGAESASAVAAQAPALAQAKKPIAALPAPVTPVASAPALQPVKAVAARSAAPVSLETLPKQRALPSTSSKKHGTDANNGVSALGYLQLTTATPARAFLASNGKFLGSTPLWSTPLPAGPQQIRIEPVNGGHFQLLTVNVGAGHTSIVTVTH
jgi:serine/threonine protein kinase